jgi:hypothetical protein
MTKVVAEITRGILGRDRLALSKAITLGRQQVCSRTELIMCSRIHIAR